MRAHARLSAGDPIGIIVGQEGDYTQTINICHKHRDTERRPDLKVSSETQTVLETSGLKGETREVFFFCHLFPRQLPSVMNIKAVRKVILIEGQEFRTALLGFSFSLQLTPNA